MRVLLRIDVNGKVVAGWLIRLLFVALKIIYSVVNASYRQKVESRVKLDDRVASTRLHIDRYFVALR